VRLGHASLQAVCRGTRLTSSDGCRETSSCSLIRYPRFAKAEITNSYEAFAVPASERSRDKQSYSGAPLVILCGERAFCKANNGTK
jgi:hypothetical protein